MFHIPAHKNVANPAGQIVNPEYKNPQHFVRPPAETRPDFVFADHGSICLLTPISADAKDWVRNSIDPHAQRFGNGIAIEPRYVDDILAGIAADGLEVA